MADKEPAMLCFEVYRNGKKLCTSGVGQYGVMSAIVTWASHHPEKLARRAKEAGLPPPKPEELTLHVGGLRGAPRESREKDHVRWAEDQIGVGDEILIRVVQARRADPPRHRKVSRQMMKKHDEAKKEWDAFQKARREAEANKRKGKARAKA